MYINAIMVVFSKMWDIAYSKLNLRIKYITYIIKLR